MLERVGQWLRCYAEKDGRGYPDWAMRYVPVVRRLRRLGKCDGQILEIGANENGFARFAGVRTIVIDLAMDHLKAARATQDVLPVRADIAALPFRQDSFDLCVCMDTFEHLPREVRRAAAAQIAAVTKDNGVAVIAFPSGEKAERAEREVQSAYEAATGRRLHWFEEHAQHGLPDAGRIREQFETVAGQTHKVTVKKNANLRVWRGMWNILICGWPGRGNALFQALLRWMTPLLCRMHFGPCYRSVIWMEPK